MLKKFCISLFIVIYTVFSTGLSFADDISAGDTAGGVEIVTDVESSVSPASETPPLSESAEAEVSPVIEETTSNTVIGPDTSIPLTSSENGETVVELPIESIPGTAIESDTSLVPENDILLELLSAGEEIIPTTEEIPSTTESVEVEENSIFTPPDPEPEPWQPTFVDNTIDIPEGRSETQSDPVFLAENSVFTRRMTSEVIVDSFAQHRCKVDIFHTDISESPNSLLEVKFYGTSTLASYDAEIGSLPDGIDVRFEKNNDYMYDFRGKETLLKLIVNKQDSSLSGDFTIPIIYTYKGKKESTVICQLNIINEEQEIIEIPQPEKVEPIKDVTEVEETVAIGENEELTIIHDVVTQPDYIERILELVSVPDLQPGELELIIIPEILPQPENVVNAPISDPIEEVMRDILTPSPEDNLESIPLEIDPVPIVESLTPLNVPKT